LIGGGLGVGATIADLVQRTAELVRLRQRQHALRRHAVFDQNRRDACERTVRNRHEPVEQQREFVVVQRTERLASAGPQPIGPRQETDRRILFVERPGMQPFEFAVGQQRPDRREELRVGRHGLLGLHVEPSQEARREPRLERREAAHDRHDQRAGARRRAAGDRQIERGDVANQCCDAAVETLGERRLRWASAHPIAQCLRQRRRCGVVRDSIEVFGDLVVLVPLECVEAEHERAPRRERRTSRDGSHRLARRVGQFATRSLDERVGHGPRGDAKFVIGRQLLRVAQQPRVEQVGAQRRFGAFALLRRRRLVGEHAENVAEVAGVAAAGVGEVVPPRGCVGEAFAGDREQLRRLGLLSAALQVGDACRIAVGQQCRRRVAGNALGEVLRVLQRRRRLAEIEPLADLRDLRGELVTVFGLGMGLRHRSGGERGARVLPPNRVLANRRRTAERVRCRVTDCRSCRRRRSTARTRAR
jgi:hypothetical protein